MRNGRQRLLPFIAGVFITAVVAGAGHAPPVAADDPADTVIDDFSATHGLTMLTFPPAGSFGSSSSSGAGIIGGERDIRTNLSAGVIAGNTVSSSVEGGNLLYAQQPTITGDVEIQWDGADNSDVVVPTGLGGIDLTGGGTKSAFALAVESDDVPIAVTIDVYTDAGNASRLVNFLPGLIATDTAFVVPFAGFSTISGTGADFADVGAIVLRLGSAWTAPTVVVQSLTTTSMARVTMTDSLAVDVAGDGVANPGDTIEYTATITNPDDIPALSIGNAEFALTPTAGASLVVGSVTASPGSVTSGNIDGDTTVTVDAGNLGNAESVTITFRVLIGAFSGDITNQGVVTYLPVGRPLGTASTATDDPDTATFSDGTLTQVVEPAVITTTTTPGTTTPGTTTTTTTTTSDTTAPGTTLPPSTLPPPPTTAPLAPTIPPTLPATGGSSSSLAIWALLTLGIGTTLTLTVRRRRA